MTRWRTGHRRAKRPHHVCRHAGHVEEWGYGLAFGGVGAYRVCRRCGILIQKYLDADDDY